MALGKGGLGKGLDALFPSNVDINTLGGDVSHETSEKIIEKCSYEATVKKEIELIKKEYVVKENNNRDENK